MSLLEDSEHSKHFLRRYMTRPKSLRSVLPKVVLLGAFVAAVMLWMMAGPYYKGYSLSNTASNQPVGTAVPPTPESTSKSTSSAAIAPIQPDPVPPVAPPQTGPFGSKHIWGVQTPYHLYGEGAKNRTQIGKEKATLVMLVRNRELKDALKSMKMIEDRFNRIYKYPWTFLNDEPFTEEFVNHTTRIASGEVQHGLIPHDQWSVPEWIDHDKFQSNMKDFADRNIIYGGSESYRHMCRYNSGFFWRSKLLEGFDWYWRVEPSTSFFCDQLYDPFTFMRENNKRYSFVMTMYEYRATIETLWSSTREFAKLKPQYIAKDNSLGFLVDDFDPKKDNLQEKDFNLCHFWSNFEIADLNLWRSPAYRDYFEFLDKKGGFFYERWGDAPVHSIAAALFLPKEQIHFWHDIGYKHPPYQRCPSDNPSMDFARCDCPFEPHQSFDFDGYSCQKRWWKFHGQNDKGKPIPKAKVPDY